MRILIIVFFMIISAIVQHVTHEMLHVIVGKINGLKLIRIQWFTYHGGTKVFFEDEPDFTTDTKRISKEWVYMSAAGIVGTNIMAYLFVLIFCLLPLGYFKQFVWVLAIFFLLTDSSYAVLGSAANFGDTYLIKEYYKMTRLKMTIVTLIHFLINCVLVYTFLL